jgi:hypothetical protein
MAGREARARENQRLFRTGNERIGDVAKGAGSNGTPIPFLCECASETCLGRVELTFSEYGRIRAGENQFVILPGHETIPGERLIEDNGRYHVVLKDDP